MRCASGDEDKRTPRGRRHGRGAGRARQRSADRADRRPGSGGEIRSIPGRGVRPRRARAPQGRTASALPHIAIGATNGLDRGWPRPIWPCLAMVSLLCADPLPSPRGALSQRQRHHTDFSGHFEVPPRPLRPRTSGFPRGRPSSANPAGHLKHRSPPGVASHLGLPSRSPVFGALPSLPAPCNNVQNLRCWSIAKPQAPVRSPRQAHSHVEDSRVPFTWRSGAFQVGVGLGGGGLV
jgi:hypothetical protein